MVRIENIDMKIEQVRKYARLLKPFYPCDVDQLKMNPERLAACERFIFLACQCTIEVAEMLGKILKLPRPDTMADSFEQLRLAGVIDAKLCASLVAMVSFRNALSHAYDKFNYKILQDVLNNKLGDFDLFIDAVTAKLNV
jgi:uncharacterized protein YutE (UPF0331/DUF86 family)